MKYSAGGSVSRSLTPRMRPPLAQCNTLVGGHKNWMLEGVGWRWATLGGCGSAGGDGSGGRGEESGEEREVEPKREKNAGF